jgi:hypothetical protein
MKSSKLPTLILIFLGAAVVALILKDLFPAKPARVKAIIPNTTAAEPTTEYPIILEANSVQSDIVWSDQSTQQDQQGAVSVEVTPVNLNDPGGTLFFEVTLNTHSVDLSMDLANLSTLNTDNGLIINGTLWDAPLGGHHVSGRLSFSIAETDLPLLKESNRLTLIIRDLDAPERSFVWNK